MSVADLFATQTAFNQRGLYQDTPESNQAWKTAFDIANNFGNTAETFRKHDENMATSAYRVGAMNAENKQKIDLSPWQTQASIAKAQYDTQTLPARAAYDISRYGDWTVNENARREAQAAQYAWNATNANAQSANAQAGLDLANWIGQNKVNPLTGGVRTDMEMLTLAQQQGLDVNNPLVFAQLVNPAQKFAQNSANTIAAYNPAYASQTRAIAGLSDIILNENGQAIDFNSGNVIGDVPKEAQPHFAGYVPTQTSGSRSSALDTAQFRANEARDLENRRYINDTLSKAVANVRSENGINIKAIEPLIASLVQQYPDQAEYIRNRLLNEMYMPSQID